MQSTPHLFTLNAEHTSPLSLSLSHSVPLFVLDMAATSVIAVLGIFVLVLQPSTAFVNEILSPIISPILDGVCKDVVECGQGTCKPSNNSFSFECECQPGWKQTRSDDDDHLKFLPCIVPNCTLNYSCTNTSFPVPVKEDPDNKSIFDPCHWTDCGGGNCTKTSAFSYNCECAKGYFNLFNVSAFSCIKECSLGADCPIGVSRSNTSTPTSAMPNNGSNNACTNLGGNYHWFIILTMSLTLFFWK